MGKSFETKKKDRKVVEFDLDGVGLQARQPKSTALLDLYENGSNGSSVQRVEAARVFIDDCLLPESAEHLNARLDDPDDDFELEDLTAILNWLSEEFLDPNAPYWAVQRIFASAKANWAHFDGSLALAGVDPRDLSPSRFLNAFTHWVRERVDDTEWARINAQWSAPPSEPTRRRQHRSEPTDRQEVSSVDEAEGAAFMAFMGAHAATAARTGQR